MTKILAVESSCDETAMAVVADGRRVIASKIASQIDVHALYGGVVPEIASRRHVEALDALLDEMGDVSDIDAVAVTYGPGLVGALLTGVSWAKGYAYARKLPLVPVNHIEGHVSANYIAHAELAPPFICLIASGGHSNIVRVDDYCDYKLLGGTVDDAAGEAFDKAARVIGIPYPGGPLLDEMAERGNENAYVFPKAKLSGRYDYSFSGVKTAVINQTHQLRQQGIEINAIDFAASFRKNVVDALVEKAVLAASDSGLTRLAVSGGVAANRLLRRELTARGMAMGLEVFMPPARLCTDNAEMIGSAGYYRFINGARAELTLNAEPALGLEAAKL